MKREIEKLPESVKSQLKVRLWCRIIGLLCGTNVLARHALWRYDNAFLQNENAIRSFQITLFSMSNNCLFGVMITGFCNVITVHKIALSDQRSTDIGGGLCLCFRLKPMKSKPDQVEDHNFSALCLKCCLIC